MGKKQKAARAERHRANQANEVFNLLVRAGDVMDALASTPEGAGAALAHNKAATIGDLASEVSLADEAFRHADAEINTWYESYHAAKAEIADDIAKIEAARQAREAEVNARLQAHLAKTPHHLRDQVARGVREALRAEFDAACRQLAELRDEARTLDLSGLETLRTQKLERRNRLDSLIARLEAELVDAKGYLAEHELRLFEARVRAAALDEAKYKAEVVRAKRASEQKLDTFERVARAAERHAAEAAKALATENEEVVAAVVALVLA